MSILRHLKKSTFRQTRYYRLTKGHTTSLPMGNIGLYAPFDVIAKEEHMSFSSPKFARSVVACAQKKHAQRGMTARFLNWKCAETIGQIISISPKQAGQRVGGWGFV